MRILYLTSAVLLISGCSPEVKIKAPEEPVTINLNVAVDHKIKVEMDKDVKQAISENKDVF